MPRKPQSSLAQVQVLPPESQTDAPDDSIFQPFFATKAECKVMKAAQTIPNRKKWRLYFDSHGCLHCHKQDELYGSCGLCAGCHGKIASRLYAVIEQEESRLGIASMPASIDAAKLARRAIAPSIRKLRGASRLLLP